MESKKSDFKRAVDEANDIHSCVLERTRVARIQATRDMESDRLEVERLEAIETTDSFEVDVPEVVYRKRRKLPSPVHETIGVGDVISYYEPIVGTRRATVLEVDCGGRLRLKSGFVLGGEACCIQKVYCAKRDIVIDMESGEGQLKFLNEFSYTKGVLVGVKSDREEKAERMTKYLKDLRS